MANNEIRTHSSKKIFVTGGSGLVGSHLIPQLIRNGHTVTASYRNAIPIIPHSDKVHWVEGDTRDVIFLEETLQSADEVYHCAALVSFNPKDKRTMLQVNVAGTANVVNAALNTGVQKLCYVSSVAAFGKPPSASKVNETITYTEQKQDSNYGLSKYLAETEVWRGIGEGLKAVIVNPTIILGPGDWTNGSTQIFKSAYDSFSWYAEGVTGFVDVQDVVKAMISLMDSEISGERFIINAENKTYKEVFTAIANAFGKRLPSKKINRFLAALVWRLESIKSVITGNEPLVTKETAHSALIKIEYDNRKLQEFIPAFSYTPIGETIQRVCGELKEKYESL